MRAAKVSVVLFSISIFAEKRFDFGDFVSSFCREMSFLHWKTSVQLKI